METGFTAFNEQSHSYMRFHGRGAVLIATATIPTGRTECMVCHAGLPWKSGELLRAA